MSNFPRALLLASCFAMTACSAAAGPGDDTESSDETARSIIGGTKATAYPESALVDMKQGGQIVASCSGSIIAPRVVLTAGHCVHGFSGWNVTAPFANSQKASTTSAATYDWNNDTEYVNPNQHDIGLIFLNSDITLSSYPKISSAGLASGTKIVNIGRIHDGQFSSSSLYVSSPIGITGGKSYGFPYDYVATEVIESGDSGGPDMLPGAAPHTIVAVNSGAGGGTEVLARVDLVYQWIQNQIAAHASASPPSNGSGGSTGSGGSGCGAVTYEGECQGNTVVWCDGGLHSIKCGTCGWDAKNGFYNCL